MRIILPRLFEEKKSATKCAPGGGEEGFGDWEGEARDAAAAHGDAFRTLPGEVVL